MSAARFTMDDEPEAFSVDDFLIANEEWDGAQEVANALSKLTVGETLTTDEGACGVFSFRRIA